MRSPRSEGEVGVEGVDEEKRRPGGSRASGRRVGFGGVVVALTRRKEGATREARYQALQTVQKCRQLVIRLLVNPRRVAPGKVDGGMSSVAGVAMCDGSGRL